MYFAYGYTYFFYSKVLYMSKNCINPRVNCILRDILMKLHVFMYVLTRNYIYLHVSECTCIYAWSAVLDPCHYYSNKYEYYKNVFSFHPHGIYGGKYSYLGFPTLGTYILSQILIIKTFRFEDKNPQI